MRTHRKVFRRGVEVIYRLDRPHVDGPYTDYLVTKDAAGEYFIKSGIPLPAEFFLEADELFAQVKVLKLQREEDEKPTGENYDEDWEPGE